MTVYIFQYKNNNKKKERNKLTKEADRNLGRLANILRFDFERRILAFRLFRSIERKKKDGLKNKIDFEGRNLSSELAVFLLRQRLRPVFGLCDWKIHPYSFVYHDPPLSKKLYSLWKIEVIRKATSICIHPAHQIQSVTVSKSMRIIDRPADQAVTAPSIKSQITDEGEIFQ